MKPTKVKVLIAVFALVHIAIPASIRIDTVLAVRKLKTSIGKPFDENSATYEVIVD